MCPMKKILIVDDDPALLMVASMALGEVAGLEVIEARGGLEALEFAKQGIPDAILMDVVLPDIDGLDILEKLGKDQRTKRIPIIFHTAKTEPSYIKRLMALGAKGVIEKPFDPMMLATEIKRILAQ
jgi:two-component system, OmpR family, response regulator